MCFEACFVFNVEEITPVIVNEMELDGCAGCYNQQQELQPMASQRTGV